MHTHLRDKPQHDSTMSRLFRDASGSVWECKSLVMSKCEARTKDWSVFSITLSLVITSFDKLVLPPLGRVLH